MSAVAGVLPWYRQVWPWILISIPGVAVLAGISMIYLAGQGADSLVVDDYYKKGKAINQQLARDVVAADMQLHASIKNNASGMLLNIAGQGFDAPDVLQGQLVHIAHSNLDVNLVFVRLPDNSYKANVSLPDSGWWRLHIEDPAGKWRLVSPKWEGGSGESVELGPRINETQAPAKS